MRFRALRIAEASSLKLKKGSFLDGPATHAKVVIVGSGPAGYTAAIYAARAMLEPILIQGIQPGGQLTITTDVENYPGFADVIQGPWLMEQMQKQAEHVGTRIVTDHASKVDLARRPFRIECDSGDRYLADSVIIATGAQARWLELPSEQKFKGYGVSACATCDGFFYRGKEVSRDRRRQYRGRRGAVPHQFRHQGHGGASARELPRRENPAGPAVQESEDFGDLEQRAGGGARARTTRSRSRASFCATSRPMPSPRCRRTGYSSPSAIPRRPSCSPDKWR